MKKKILENKLIPFSIILIIILYAINPIVYAAGGLAGGAQAEAPNAPAPAPTPVPPVYPESPVDPITPVAPEKQTNITKTITCYTSIEGNVYEDLGEGINEGELEKISVYGVKVGLYKDGRYLETTITDKNGNYSFKNLDTKYGDGIYKTKFAYGNIDGMNDVELIKNTLKYNGQDYVVTKTPQSNNGNRIDIEKTEIIKSGKSVTQVFLLLDCSQSAYTTEVTLTNGTKKKRIEIEIEATKNLVNKLLNSSDSIYVGVIAFNGDSRRAVSLTRNEEKIRSALESYRKNDWVIANTDIVKALDKAKESFANNDKENSNRVIALISDCVPTAAGNTKVYRDESESETLRKLKNIIGPETRNKLVELKNDQIKIMTLAVEAEDEETKTFVKSIFNEESTNFLASINDGDKMINAIENLLKDAIFTQIKTESQSYQDGDQLTTKGYEDEERRKKVNNNFKNFDYKKAKLFDVINEYDGSQEQEDKAKELSDKAYMIVHGGEYAITSPGQDYSYDYVDNEGDTITVSVKYITCTYTNQDLYIGLRSTPDIQITTTITGLKVILQNGVVLTDLTQKMKSEFPLISTMAEDLSYGSNIQIEYEIEISNKSIIQYNYLELINYLPKGFDYTGSVLTKGINAKGNYENINNLEELYNNQIIDVETYKECKDRKAMSLKFDNKGQGENGFYLPVGGKLNIKIYASRLMNSINDEENETINTNIIEVLNYSNIESRRMGYKKTGIDNKMKLASIYPGDIRNYDSSSEATNNVVLIPPTGKEKDYFNITFAGLGAMLIFVNGLRINRKIKKRS